MIIMSKSRGEIIKNAQARVKLLSKTARTKRMIEFETSIIEAMKRGATQCQLGDAKARSYELGFVMLGDFIQRKQLNKRKP